MIVVNGGSELTGVPHQGLWSDTGRTQPTPDKRWPGREFGPVWSALACPQDQVARELRSPMKKPIQPTETRNMVPRKRKTEKTLSGLSLGNKGIWICMHAAQIYKAHPFLTESNSVFCSTGHCQHLDAVHVTIT